MYEVLTFGEAMLRFNPPFFRRIEQASDFFVEVGGAELNVAVGLSRLGLRSGWISKVTDNSLGRIIVNKAKGFGVNVDNIIWTKDHRVGLYFVEFGASPRPSSVIYDRKNSAIAHIKEDEIDWEKVLSGCSIFHTSGITPALSEGAKGATISGIRAAKRAGCKVSFDINHRENLWSPEEANECMIELIPYIDILITTEEDSNVVLGIGGEDYGRVAEELSKKYKFEVVTITIREDITVWRNNWTAIAYANGKLYKDRKYEMEMVDRLGGGDSFSAGFLYGYLSKNNVQAALEYGNAFAALKHTNPGDFNYANLDEVEKLIRGEAGLRIQR